MEKITPYEVYKQWKRENRVTLAVTMIITLVVAACLIGVPFIYFR